MKVERLSTLDFARRFVGPKFPRLAEIIEYPMVGPILDRIDANPGSIFVILGAPQIFKTLIGQLVALRSQLVCPAPALWYGKNEQTAEQVAEEKFNPLYDSVMPTVMVAGKPEPTPGLLYTDKYKRTKTAYTLPGGEILRFLSAGVPINRQGKSAQDIYMDEPWEFEPGWIKEIQRRHGDFPRYRELHMLTGPTWGSYSHELWEQSTREVWHMRCTAPTCRKLIAPNAGDGIEPGGLRYESGPSVRDADGNRILSATRKTVEFECPHCGTRYPNTQHSRTALNAGGELVQTNPHPETHIHGFRCPALPLRDWAEIVVEKIVADRARKRGDIELTEDLHRKTYADVWREETHLSEKKLRPVAEYRLGEEWPQEAKDPSGRPVRCATVDVQLDHFVLVIRMWGKSGASRLRWCEKVTTPGRIRDLCMEHGVIPERVYLDGRHETQHTRRTAAAHGWRVLLGEADKDYFHKETGLRRIFSEPRMIDAFAGTDRRGVVAEFNFSKQSALSRLHLLRTLTEPVTGLPLWTSAKDAPEWYWKEIEAHYRTKQHNPDGSAYYVWKGLRDDHAGDCEAMQVVFASMAGLVGAESLETEAESPKPPS
jgi:predicted RNA-binding Zn-ribbon protein involved in translation (DUF1610 family)